MACFNCHKIGHLSRECKSQSYNWSANKNRFNKKKEQNDLKGKKITKEIRNEMKKTWIKKDEEKKGQGHSETKSSSIGDDRSTSN